MMETNEEDKNKSKTVMLTGEQENPQAGISLKKSSASISQTNENEAIKTKSTKAIKNRIGWPFWVAAVMFVAVVVFHFSDLINPPPESVGRINHVVAKGAAPPANEVEALRKKRQFELERQKLELEKKKLLADVELRIQKYKGDVTATIERYRKMIPLSEADAAFRRSEDGASFIASKEGLCGFTNCVSLAYKMAYDKVKGTTRTEDAISPIVKEKVVDEIEKAVVVYARWTADFRRELATEEAALAADLAVKSKTFENAVSVLSDENAKSVSLALDAFSSDIQKHASDAAITAVGLVVETIMIKTSYSAIKKLVMSVARVALLPAVNRITTSLSTSAIVAVLDGPEPGPADVVAGVITLAGLSWTVVDIYNVTKTMPDEMKVKIQQSISQTRMELEKRAIENLQKAKVDCEASAEQKLSEIKKILKGE